MCMTVLSQAEFIRQEAYDRWNFSLLFENKHSWVDTLDLTSEI